LASETVKQGLSVRDVERLVSDKKPNKSRSKAKRSPEKDTDTRALEKSIADNLGLTVAIQHEKDGGHVRVAYKTLEQLDEVVRRLTASS
jgi:ParB family chromosome partitioning protein